ncbi:FtsX-like permease family protein [Streptomyces yangpuensis]|uniref:FtsX-like permease family protein n=1 Tax=Streptomyces yangpuensis TaxID=1648182 RepID=A0ABY5Q749_9ACTN|nr:MULTISPECIES: FtsX-like permease family protein [Streptomyces]UUY52050.1 FtsX-like permease family protein [Streptomyces yangpuensis]
MIALPIVGVSAADLTLRSAELSPDQAVSRVVGAADARISTSHAGRPIHQVPDGSHYVPVGGFDDAGTPSKPKEETPDQVAAALPPGTRLLKDSDGYGKVRTQHGLLDTDLREIDLRDPLAKGLFTLDRGRLPERAGEVVATNAFLENSGLFVGSSVTPRGATSSYKVVGAYELPNDLKREQIIAPPGSLIAPLDKALRAAGGIGVLPNDSYLVTVGGEGFTWNMVQAANAKSLVVVSRAVANRPPADADVPLYRQEPKEQFERSAGGATHMAILATIVGLAMLEICLLAGPAFAVGARRSRRQLGLVGANGGDRSHIRSIVLAGGLVIGAAAAVSGTAIGLTLTVALQPLLEEQLGERFGSLDFRPLELAGIALLAVVTGLLSAIVPAVTASRQTVLASLTGRRGVRRANRVLPVAGLVAVAVGAGTALYGSVADMGATVVAGGSALAELGIVALTPVLVGLFGRIGRWLPLSPRLALRDAVRNRGRTAPAVAAVLAAVAGTVAVATYQHSSEIQSRHEYIADLPHGTGWLLTSENGAYQEVPALRESLTKQLPVARRADVDRLVVGRPGCESFSEDPTCGRVEIITPKDQRCPLHERREGPDTLSAEDARKLRQDWRCKGAVRGTQYSTVIADEKLLSILAVTDPGSVSALKQGRALAFDRRQVKDGKVTLRIIAGSDRDEMFAGTSEEPVGVDKVLPVHLAPEGTESWGLELVLPPAAVQATGLTTAPIGSYFALDGTATSEQRQRIAGDIDRMGVEASLRIEAGYQGDDSLVLLALTVFAGLVTIGAAGIATGLSQADAEADLKTLAAVGAPPRVRRTLSGFQCGVVALMGVVLGSAAGILPAIGLRLTQRRELEALARRAADDGYSLTGESVPFVPIAVPWETLAQLLVVVPLGAALLAALVTRSSGALARRAAG